MQRFLKLERYLENNESAMINLEFYYASRIKSGLEWVHWKDLKDETKKSLKDFYKFSFLHIYHTPNSKIYSPTVWSQIINFITFQPTAFVVNSKFDGQFLFYAFRLIFILFCIVNFLLGLVACLQVKRYFYGTYNIS